MSGPGKERLGLRAAPWLLWFGVLGAGMSWTAHTLVDWGLEETVCRSGHDEVLGLPLRPVLGVLAALFAVVCAASTAVAFGAWRRLAHADPPGGLPALRQRRAELMALIGFVGGLLFTLMTLMGAVAVLVVPVCAG